MQLDSHRNKMCYAYKFLGNYHDTEEEFFKTLLPVWDPPAKADDAACSSPSTASETSLRTPTQGAPLGRDLLSPKAEREKDHLDLLSSEDQLGHAPRNNGGSSG